MIEKEFICCRQFSVILGENFKKTEFEQSPGLYYDFVSNLKFYDSTWKIVTYLDISHIESKLRLIGNTYDKTATYCNENTVYRDLMLCNSSMTVLEHMIPEMRVKEGYLKNLIGHTRIKITGKIQIQNNY